MVEFPPRKVLLAWDVRVESSRAAHFGFASKKEKEMCAKEDDEYICGDAMSVAPELVAKGILV